FGDKPDPDPPPEEPFVPDGIIPGYAIAHIRDPNAKVGSPVNDIRMLHPGDEVVLVTLGSGGKNPIVDVRLAVRDYFKSGMSDADSSTVYVALDMLQHLRTMEHRASSIQIKLKDYQDAKAVTDRLKELFPSS